MTEPHPDSATPRTAQGNVDIGVDVEPDSSPTAIEEGPADEPTLTTSEEAQRDDLLVQPGNS